MTRDVVIFDHIPKTAGTTVRTILRNQYHPDNLVIEGNLMLPEVVDRLRDRLDGGGTPIRMVGGHVGYGIHEQLVPGYRYRYFTFLRHPVERVISQYYQWLRSDKIPADLPLTDFVTSRPIPGRNLQTTFLTGAINAHFRGGGRMEDLMGPHAPLSLDPDSAAAEAKEALRRHAVVGLTERFDETLLLLYRAFGWTWYRLPYLKHNKGHNRPPRSEISPEVRAFVADHNRLDMEVYTFAEKLFAEQLAESGAWVARRLPLFQSANRLFTRVAPAVRPFARRLGPRRR